MPICTRPCCGLSFQLKEPGAPLRCHCGAPALRSLKIALVEGGKNMTRQLNAAGTFVVGRRSSSVEQPDIDLSDYLADPKAISRRHVSLLWYGNDKVRISPEPEREVSVNGVPVTAGKDFSVPISLVLGGTVRLTIEQEA